MLSYLKIFSGVVMFLSGCLDFGSPAGRTRILFGLYILGDCLLDKVMPRVESVSK